ncbi:LLM class F420-dependent oxidoreductase [Nocardia sp. CDC159]|uniref:LLM class F420-dependent oxidoreductase n=1 Tax=Nocardia pulmonis TaxID=2951408 RepID=A0A9X2E914_9NOCA|nr:MULTISPECIES: LLM class F420-dependent oxidoreductase [Nocardia]MCM6773728.1 LLM class F420-dependent oxidoreductase [Nocardia pulmonis]MCM6786615.1 LLM class F420-dependent oxidoreductase [Nocardia sp. CDC159]
MRIGIMLGQPTGSDALLRLTDDLRQAAEEGFQSAWLSHIFGIDALTALAVAGSQVPGIELGTGVVPTYPRHPGALAQQARTTALAVGPDRLSLGIGLSHRIVIENMYGYDFDKPARHMKEYLSVLLPLLAGEPVSYAGETIRANLALEVPNEDRVPVLLAAMGPQMLKLAGRRTDGTVLWMTGPATIRTHIAPIVTEAAAAAGRPAPRVVCALPVCVTDDADAARNKAATVFEAYGTLPSYRAMMDREGVAGPGDLAIVGTEDQVAARIHEIIASGATEFVGALFTGGESAARTRKLLAGLAS